MQNDQTSVFSFMVPAPNANQMHAQMMISKAALDHHKREPIPNKRQNAQPKNVRFKKEHESTSVKNDNPYSLGSRGEFLASIGAAMHSYDPDSSGE